jgi:hypothetical protein
MYHQDIYILVCFVSRILTGLQKPEDVDMQTLWNCFVKA